MAPENKTQANTNKMIKLSKRPYPDSDTYSDSESEVDESTTYFPSYMVLESVEDKPITQISSFIKEKFLCKCGSQISKSNMQQHLDIGS